METTYTLTVDAEKAEQTLDRLIQKAEYLKSLMGDINNIDEEIELAEKLQKPQIVYAISMGNMMEIANAPADLFQPEFLETLSKDMQQIIKPKKKIEKKGKILDLTNSNNYKV